MLCLQRLWPELEEQQCMPTRTLMCQEFSVSSGTLPIGSMPSQHHPMQSLTEYPAWCVMVLLLSAMHIIPIVVIDIT